MRLLVGMAILVIVISCGDYEMENVTVQGTGSEDPPVTDLTWEL
jgi:hypothetical protein